jgi:hypothetical protein
MHWVTRCSAIPSAAITGAVTGVLVGRYAF